jgi:wee1-like protein kinase
MSLFKPRRRLKDAIQFTPVNKKLNFNLDDSDLEGSDVRTRDVQPIMENHPQFDLELDLGGVYNQIDNFSPCRTRSGCVYESGRKKRKFRISTKSSRKNLSGRKRTSSGQSGTGSAADCSENGSEISEDNLGSVHCDRLDFFGGVDPSSPHPLNYVGGVDPSSPPPLNYVKNPVSRFSFPRERRHRHDIPSSPISHPLMEQDLSSPIHKTTWGPEPDSPTLSFSPPTNPMRAMRLFDVMSSPNTACALTSPRSTPRANLMKSRLRFDEDGEFRRASLPNTQMPDLDTGKKSLSINKCANINPFTPAAMLAASKKRSRGMRLSNTSNGSSREELQASLDSMEGVEGEEEEEEDEEVHHAKRVRVSDINITRYDEEFLELSEIASGQFGTVKLSRHRLDGIVYAIKISKHPLRVNSHDEKMAMNEVFAHAALMKHKHVVRYYNSWVEKGQVYIQNEYCEGGSLQSRIQELRSSGTRFPEHGLKKIIMHVAKGLQYIHSKQLVHLDIKPGNIFISLEYPTLTPPRSRTADHSTDSGAASGDHADHSPRGGRAEGEEPTSPGDGEKVHYKIGDLGHVACVHGGEVSPEEGDCRYMAPEFLEMEVERSRLPKADIFSLGLTVFEAASLRTLPRNSQDDPDYEKLKRGELPYLNQYSREFNLLLKSMVDPEPSSRPSAIRLLANSSLNPSMSRSRSQLCKELREAKEKVALLENIIVNTPRDHKHQDKENNKPGQKLAKRLVGRGSARSSSTLD